jgi:hypothetical protein
LIVPDIGFQQSLTRLILSIEREEQGQLEGEKVGSAGSISKILKSRHGILIACVIALLMLGAGEWIIVDRSMIRGLIPQVLTAQPAIEFYDVSGLSSEGTTFVFQIPKTDGPWKFSTSVVDSSGKKHDIFVGLERKGYSVTFRFFMDQTNHPWHAWDNAARLVLKDNGTFTGELKLDLGDGNREPSKYTLKGILRKTS